MPLSTVQAKASQTLPLFLLHRFPRIRAMCAERLYMTLSQEGDVDEELESVLLETDWVGELSGESELVRILLQRQLHISP